MRRTQTHQWDAAEHLKTEEDRAAYLDAALEEHDPRLIAAALGDIASAKGMTKVAPDRPPLPRNRTRIELGKIDTPGQGPFRWAGIDPE